MKDKNKLTKVLVTVVSTIVILSGATFAYWMWITNEKQQTSVSFYVSEDSMKDQLNAEMIGGTATNINDLAPVSECTVEKHVAKLPLTLNYKNNTINGARVNATLTLSNFTTPNGTLKSEDLSHLHYSLTTSDISCTTDVVVGASGLFTSTTGNLMDNVLILNNIEPNVTDSQDYYLWIWLDSGYNYQNEGDANYDPMQNISFTVTWSGEINNDVILAG